MYRLVRRQRLWWQRVREEVAAECRGNVVQTLEAAPEGLCTGRAVGFAAEEATELGDHQDHLVERGRLIGWWLAGVEDDQGFPLLGLESLPSRKRGPTVQGTSGVARPSQVR